MACEMYDLARLIVLSEQSKFWDEGMREWFEMIVALSGLP